jgi:MoaA/NifB/PqqE/SkfB family radical SAM enzyme
MYCNLECPMCLQYQNGTTVSGPHMELEAFLAVAEALFPLVERVQFSVSGEPLMSKRLDRLVDVAARHGVRVEYYTNGTLLDERMLARILPTLGRLNVSFDGATRATFERVRAGADFERVKEHVRAAATALRALPPDRRPALGFACTLLSWNVRELPQLVELAHELGVDFVSASHMVPVTREMQALSLASHLDLAADCIRAAAQRARELGMPLEVQGLGDLIRDMASAEEPATYHERAPSGPAAAFDVLRGVSVLPERRPGWPAAPERAERAPRARDPAPAEGQPERMLACDFLWDRIYVSHGGDVHPCCMPGNPLVGSLRASGVDELWNGAVYRAMRLGLALGEPAPVCRGCQNLRSVEDPAEIARLLRGRSLAGARLPPLPPSLRPIRPEPRAPAYGTRVEPVLVSAPPRLAWPAVEGADGYEVEFSLDDFRNVLVSTAWVGFRIPRPEVEVPEWAWTQAPSGRAIAWRALALCAAERPVAARGVLVRAGG